MASAKAVPQRLQSVCENPGIFVGRGFSHDVNRTECERL